MRLTGQFKFQIRPQDCDFTKRVMLSVLGDYILQTAGKNADENGFGMSDLNRSNRTWVVSRMAIEMTRLPRLHEWITIETWIESIGRATTSRNFRIADDSGSQIGGASTIWAMIDTETRRAVDLKTLGELEAFVAGYPSVIDPPKKITQVEGDPVDSHTIRYSDIDFNQHANSMKYVEWLLDRFDIDWYKTHCIRRFEINFMHEVLFGETVAIYQHTQADATLFEVKKGNLESACKMKIDWQTI
jgi:acyl-ACP thioesterase